MNAFANFLLHILLSWMRTLFSGLLSFVQGNDRGLLSWLGAHWLPLAVILLLVGITVDAIIYILRWRPQYVWRTRLHRLFHRREDMAAEMQFQQGFDTALPNFNFGDTPIPDLYTSESAAEEVLSDYYAQPAAPQEAFDYSQLPGANQIVEERNRRSARHSRRILRRSPLFHASELADTGRRRRGESVIDVRDAFHAPVYPASEGQPYQEQEHDEYQDL